MQKLSFEVDDFCVILIISTFNFKGGDIVIRLIIVEDEPLMNEYIANCIDYSSLGIELTGRFFNGKSAYEFLLKNKADIVITDIQMSQMDGLELISRTLEVYPEIKFIVLSNFDDFHMVKRAFKFGASDYILKTDFEPAVYTKLLSELIQTQIPTQSKKLNSAIKEVALKQFFWDGVYADKNNTMRISLKDNMFVIVMELINYDKIIKSHWDTQKELMKFGLCNLLNEVLEDFGNGEFFFNDYDEIVFIFSAEEHGPHERAVRELFANIFEILLDKFSLSIAAGICDKFVGSPLKEQYQMALEACDYYFIYGKGMLIEHSVVQNKSDVINTNELTKEIEDAFTDLRFDALSGIINKLGNLKPSHSYLTSLRNLYKAIANHLAELAKTYELPQIYELLDDINTEYDSQRELTDKLLNASNQLSGILTHSDMAILQVQNYIYQNYSQDITLQFLAKQFLFNYSDLSRRFRKATGMSFTKFLINIRLEEAMKLIRTTDYNFSKIASMVGYNNYENFSRAIKSKYKKWPNEFRKGDKP